MGKGGWEGDARGKGYGDTCIHIADALCYTAETNTPLEGNYTPIKMLKKKKELFCFSVIPEEKLLWLKAWVAFGFLWKMLLGSLRIMGRMFGPTRHIGRWVRGFWVRARHLT